MTKYVTGDEQEFDELKDAMDHAYAVWQDTGVFITITKK